MEALFLLVLLIPVLALAGTVLGLVALRRTRRADRRIAELERLLFDSGSESLLQRLWRLEGHGKEAVAPRPAEPEGTTGETAAPPPPDMDEEITHELQQPPKVSGAPAPAAEEAVVDADEPPPQPEALTPPPQSEPPSAPASEIEAGGANGALPPTPATEALRPKIDWEQWIGVRGAAVLGGVFLALAALLFFQYSIEHGLISPTLRVILGVIVGLASLVSSEWLHRRHQEAAANALAGGGAVVLYTAIWGARILYRLIPALPAFALMALVTVVCGLLAARRSSLVIAVLGLVGGFATPLLVGADSDQPVALFSYILLLDAGLLWLARKRRWGVLAMLSLGGTALHQALWFFTTMDADAAILGLGVLAVFAVVFLVFGQRQAQENLLWRFTRSASLILPLAFSLQIAAKAPLGDHLAPVGVLLLLLSACACWLSVRNEHRNLDLVAASFSLGVVAVWFLNHRIHGAQSWEAVLVCAALGLVYQLGTEWSVRHRTGDTPGIAPVVVSVTLMLILILAALNSSAASLWVWLLGWLAQSALLVRHAVACRRPALQITAGVAPVLGLFAMAADRHMSTDFPAAALFLAVVAGLAILVQLAGLVGRAELRRRWAEHAAAATALCGILPAIVFFDQRSVSSLLPLGSTALFLVLAALAATRLRSGAWLAVLIVWGAAVHSLWSVVHWDTWGGDSFPLSAFFLQLATVALLSFWPAIAVRAFAASRAAWLSAALAGPLWFFSLKLQWSSLFGEHLIALLPLGLGGLTLAVALRARRASSAVLPVRGSALAWLLAVSLCFVTLAIPLQLDKEWITIGWAVNGLAVLALWRRLDHPGLKYFALALFGAATARLVANPQVLAYHSMGSLKIVNWLLYTYLVPAICLVFGARLLRKREAERLRPAELSLYGGRREIGAAACGLAAIAVVFVWINLCIADVFSTSSRLSLSFDRMPARDLSTSIAWAVYALVLLALGIRVRSLMLRWLSLALMLITVVKVFLHDLGQLQDLYRVASFLGLAVSLIVVSLAYQRFVLRSRAPEDS